MGKVKAIEREGRFTDFAQGLKEVLHSFFASEEDLDEKTLEEAPADIKSEFKKAYAIIEKDATTKNFKGKKKAKIEIDTEKAIKKAEEKNKDRNNEELEK